MWASCGAFCLLFFVLTLYGPQLAATERGRETVITDNTVSIRLRSGSLFQVYPIQNDTAADNCPDAKWKAFKLHKTPPEFDPLHWSTSEWEDYLKNYALPTAGLSICFLLIAVIGGLVMIIWRLVQWCAGCGGCCSRCKHSCSLGREAPDWMGDTKHAYLKGWIYLLAALALAMVVWGMLALDELLLQTFWAAVDDVLRYGDRVTEDLTALQIKLNTTLPGTVANMSAAVTALLNTTELSPLVQTTFNFAQDTLATAVSPLSASTASVSSGLGTALTGMAALDAQLTAAAAASGRHLLAGDYSSLAVLLAALAGGLPRIAAATATATSMHDKLQTLKLAADELSAQSAAGVPTAAALSALSSALGDATITNWEAQLAQLLEDCGAYEAVRAGTAFKLAENLAKDVVTGTAAVSQSLVDTVVDLTNSFDSQYRSGPQAAIKNLLSGVRSLVANTTGSRSWTVKLDNGTVTPFLALADRLLADLETYFLKAATDSGSSSSGGSGGGRHLLADDWSLAAFMQALLTGPAIAANVSAAASSFAAAATAAASVAANGTASNSTQASLRNSLAPALSAASAPTAALAAALDAYLRDKSPANQQALRDALVAASAPLNNAVTSFAVPLDPSGALESAARSLRDVTSSLDVTAAALDVAIASNQAAMAELQRVSTVYNSGLSSYKDLVSGMPTSAEVTTELASFSAKVNREVGQLGDEVVDKSKAASEDVQSATDSIKEEVLSKADNFVYNWKDDSEEAVEKVYAVWMAVYGLTILLLLVLAVAVWRNWPGGLVAAGLMLLVIIVASQALCAALAFGLAVLDDTCENVEGVAMREVATRGNNPEIAIVMSYYLYGRPNLRDLNTSDSLEPVRMMLSAAFNLNITDVIRLAESSSTTLLEQLQNKYSVTGDMLTLLEGVASLGRGIVGTLNATMAALHYDSVHPLYQSSKDLVCCDAGTFAFNQWCAMTALAALAFGALICTTYLLARMDMLVDRAGCCSCCACACYRAPNKRKKDAEAAVDKVVEAANAKKLADAVRTKEAAASRQQGPGQGLNQLIPAGPAGAGPEPSLPTGFMTAAGGAAAYAALGEQTGSHQAPYPQQAAGWPYMPPSAPPMAK